LVLVGTLTFLFIRSWRVAVLAAVLVPVLSLISHYFSQRITATARRQRGRESELSSAAQEMLTAVPVVQTFGQTEYEQERFAESSRGAEPGGPRRSVAISSSAASRSRTSSIPRTPPATRSPRGSSTR